VGLKVVNRTLYSKKRPNIRQPRAHEHQKSEQSYIQKHKSIVLDPVYPENDEV